MASIRELAAQGMGTIAERYPVPDNCKRGGAGSHLERGHSAIATPLESDRRAMSRQCMEDDGRRLSLRHHTQAEYPHLAIAEVGVGHQALRLVTNRPPLVMVPFRQVASSREPGKE